MAMDVTNEGTTTDTAVQVPNAQESTSRKSKVIMAIFIAVVLGLILIFASNWITRTTGYGVLEEQEYALTQCLTNMGVKMFGSDADSETEIQKDLFGNDFRYVNYIECSSNPGACDGLTSLPAWNIHGQVHYGVQDIDSLKILSGC